MQACAVDDSLTRWVTNQTTTVKVHISLVRSDVCGLIKLPSFSSFQLQAANGGGNWKKGPAARSSEISERKKNVSHKHPEPIRRCKCDTSGCCRVLKSCNAVWTLLQPSWHPPTYKQETAPREGRQVLLSCPHWASFLPQSREDSARDKWGNRRGAKSWKACQSLFSKLSNVSDCAGTNSSFDSKKLWFRPTRCI